MKVSQGLLAVRQSKGREQHWQEDTHGYAPARPCLSTGGRAQKLHGVPSVKDVKNPKVNSPGTTEQRPFLLVRDRTTPVRHLFWRTDPFRGRGLNRSGPGQAYPTPCDYTPVA